MMKTVHLSIRGRVQGVGFRAYMRREAQKLGIAGWVRNRIDGSVEAIAQGESEAVDTLIAWVQHGPPSARVIDVQVSGAEGSFSGFEQRPTE